MECSLRSCCLSWVICFTCRAIRLGSQKSKAKNLRAKSQKTDIRNPNPGRFIVEDRKAQRRESKKARNFYTSLCARDDARDPPNPPSYRASDSYGILLLLTDRPPRAQKSKPRKQPPIPSQVSDSIRQRSKDNW